MALFSINSPIGQTSRTGTENMAVFVNEVLFANNTCKCLFYHFVSGAIGKYSLIIIIIIIILCFKQVLIAKLACLVFSPAGVTKRIVFL